MRLHWLISLLLVSNSALALDIQITELSPFSGQEDGLPAVLLSGEIENGDHDRLVDFLVQNDDVFFTYRTFILASPGGDVDEALEIARLVQDSYAQVAVGPYSGKCVSACFLIYAAAVTRDASSGELGVHRPYVSSTRMAQLAPRQAEAHQRQVMNTVRDFLSQASVPNYLIETMLQRGSNEVYWLSESDIARMGRRPPWYDQYLIARCNLDKKAEREYWRTNNQFLLDKLVEAESCGLDSTMFEANAAIMNRLRELSIQRRRARKLLAGEVSFSDVAELQDVKTWREVRASSEFAKLSPREVAQARTQYFYQVVAPLLPDESVGAVREQFLTYDQSLANISAE